MLHIFFISFFTYVSVQNFQSEHFDCAIKVAFNKVCGIAYDSF